MTDVLPETSFVNRVMKYLLLVFLVSCSALQKNPEKSFDKILSEFKYPFEVKNFSFKSQGQDLDMAYMDINTLSSKVAVLLHGKNFSGYYWEDIARDLVNKGYRVIMPDQVGFGKSTKPEYYQYSLSNFVLNTKRLLDHLKVKSAIFVGHSMGGMMATQAAYLYPQVVKKLVLVNPIGLEPYLKYVEFKDPQFFYEMELHKTPEKFKAYQKKNYYDGKWRDDYDALLVPYSGQMRGSDWPIVAWNNALTYGPIFTEDITSKFKDIKTPVVLIIGTRDTTGPGRHWKKEGVNHKLGNYKKLGMKAHVSFPNSVLYELPGLGHMPQFEDYKAFKKVFFRNF